MGQESLLQRFQANKSLQIMSVHLVKVVSNVLGLWAILILAVGSDVVYSGDREGAEPRVLRLVTHDFPPFTYLENDRAAGPARELIDRVCEALKMRCEHRLLPWSRAQRIVKQGQADAMYVIGFNEERSHWLHFSTPLLKTEYGFFVQAEDPLRYSGQKDIQGYRIGVYGPSNTSRNLERLKGESESFVIEMSPDNEAGFRQLAVGRLDGVYSNRDVGLAVTRRLGLKGVRYAGPARKLNYYVGFSRSNMDAAFNQAFSEAYQRLEDSGEVQQVLMRHGLLPGR